MPRRRTRKVSKRRRKTTTNRRRRTTRKTRKTRKRQTTKKSRRRRTRKGGAVRKKKRSYPVFKRIPKGKRCSDLLKEKIAINIKEMNRVGKFKNRKQAIAVAYNQVSRRYPSCKSVFTRKRRSRMK